jgi:hypothetical protein
MVSGIERFGNDEISNNTARLVTNSFYASDLSRSLGIQLASPIVVQRISRMQDFQTCSFTFSNPNVLIKFLFPKLFEPRHTKSNSEILRHTNQFFFILFEEENFDSLN